MRISYRKILKRTLKTFIWLAISIVMLIVFAIVALQFSSVQNFITQKAVHFISDKTHTKVTLGEINIAFPKSIVLKDLFAEDLKHDTLLYVHSLTVDASLLKLLSHTIEVSHINLEGVTGHIKRSLPDSSFNFDFIIKAFASKGNPETKSDTSSGTPWRFALDKIDLQKIYFTFKDEPGGTDMSFVVGSFKTRIKEFDLTKKKFNIENISLDSSIGSIIQTKVSAPDTSASQPIGFDVDVKTINIAEVKFLFETPKQRLDVQLSHLAVNANKVNLPAQAVDLNDVELENSKIAFVIKKYPGKDSLANVTGQPASAKGGMSWVANAAKINMQGNSFSFNDENASPKSTGMDFSHLMLSGVAVSAKDLKYSSTNISGNISEVKASEKSGFQLKHLETKFVYDSTHAELAALDVQTGNSHISKYIYVAYPSLEKIKDSLATVKVKLNLNNSVVALNDLLYFQPNLTDQLKLKKDRSYVVRINTRAEGRIKDLRIADLQVAIDSTMLSISGNVKGLPDVNKLYADVSLQQFHTTKTDIENLMQPGLLPPDIQLPGVLNVSGDFKGYLKEFDGKAIVQSSFGNVAAKVNMRKGDNYKANLVVDNFNAGELLNQQQTLGTVSLKADITGSGFSPQTMSDSGTVEVAHAKLQGYDYKNISVKGSFAQMQFIGHTEVNDSNLVLALDGLLNFSKDNPHYQATLDLKGADLKALHFSKDPLQVKGNLKTDLAGNDINNLNGYVSLHNVAIRKNDTVYPIDSLLFVAKTDSGVKNFDVKSSFLTASIKGNMGIADIPNELTRHFNHYMNVSDSAVKESGTDRHFSFSIQLPGSPVYQVFLPDMQKFMPATISGNFSSGSQQLNVIGSFPQIQYGNMQVDSLNLNLASDRQAITYNISLSSFALADNRILNTSLTGKVQNQSLTFTLAIKDAARTLQYNFPGSLKKEKDEYVLSFDKEGVLLNYEKWNTTSDNAIKFGKEIYANNMELSNGPQSLKIASVGAETANTPLQITLHDFDLNTIGRIVNANKNLAGGIINGSVELKNIQSTPLFDANITVSDFSFKEDTLGTIKVVANNDTLNRYNLKLNINGNGNDIAANGFYSTVDKNSPLNFALTLGNVNLATIQAYTFGQLTRLKGNLKGNLKVSGTAQSPALNGSLEFNNAAFNFTYLNSYYHIKDEKLNFSGQSLSFNNFTILDSLNNKAVLNGTLSYDPVHTLAFNLSLQTDKFLAINSRANDSSQFYGKVILNSYTKISGNKDFPKIDVNAKMQKGSAFTFARRQDAVKNIESDGVVIFETKRDTFLHTMPVKRLKGVASYLKGFQLNANVEINKDSRLSILIDPDAGDSLQIKGEATLNFTMDPSGKQSLTGRYEISEGSYNLTFYNLVKRKFTLKAGSITWNGDPLKADIDLTAVLQVITSPIDLLQDQLSNMDDQQRNTYRQQLPFLLNLYLKGNMLKPDVSFSLDLPASQKGALGGAVYAKLNQLNQNEADLNKQVFALLILNRFVSDDPLQSGQGSGVEGVARNSVSQLLSQQLNRLAGNYVKGVQLNFNLQSYDDYSSGQAVGRTQLGIGVSKELFNDRLNVQVGTNVDLEGQKANQNSVNSIVGDMSAEYKLVPSGTYRLRFYRQSEYDILEGQIVETGFGFVFTKDYDVTRDLFKNSNKKSTVNLTKPGQ